MVDAAVSATYERVASRERDVRRAFFPGAVAENADVPASNDGARPVFDPLSVALPQNAYVITVDAAGKRSYTRDGAFHVSDGTLVDANGNAIEGYVNPQASLSALQIRSIDVRLDRVKNLRLEADGKLTYARAAIDPRSGANVEQRVTVGRIALARFPAGSALQSIDGIHVTSDTVAPHIGMPNDGSFSLLETQRLTKSHIDIDASLIKLQESYLAFDALRAAKQVHASTQKTATDLIK